jgi:uncharacterized protein (DUF488 family)
MCAEIIWQKCHRRYVADRLKKKGYDIIHIYDEKKSEPHKFFSKKKIKCD